MEPDAVKTESAAKETTVKYVTELKDYIISKAGNDQLLNVLVQHLASVSGKELEFEQHVLIILQKEALEQNARARIEITKLTKELKNLERLSGKRVEKAKQTNLHLLIAAQEKAENLETTVQAYAQSQSELLVERDALKRALDSKEKYIEQITNGGIEAHNQLTEEVKQLKTSLSVSQSQVQQLKDQFKTQQAELDATLKLKENLTDDKTTLITQLTASRRAVTEQKEAIANLELRT